MREGAGMEAVAVAVRLVGEAPIYARHLHVSLQEREEAGMKAVAVAVAVRSVGEAPIYTRHLRLSLKERDAMGRKEEAGVEDH